MVCLFSILYIYEFVPETHNLSLEVRPLEDALCLEAINLLCMELFVHHQQIEEAFEAHRLHRASRSLLRLVRKKQKDLEAPGPLPPVGRGDAMVAVADVSTHPAKRVMSETR